MGRSETLLNFPSGLSTWIANSALHNLKELVFFFFFNLQVHECYAQHVIANTVKLMK